MVKEAIAIYLTMVLFALQFTGYKHAKEGNLVIKEEKAENVRLFFRLYLAGQSVIEYLPQRAPSQFRIDKPRYH